MLAEFVPCRRWGQPNGVVHAPTGGANDLEPRCACFMVRYAAGNAFATAKSLGSVDEKTTLWEFQWDILKQRYFSGAEFNNTTRTAAVPAVHAPKRFASRPWCTHCRNGGTCWACGACGKHMHTKCFGDAHDV